MTNQLVSIQNFDWQYPGSKEVCLHVDKFDLAHGDFIIILGQNGSGKTTLAKLICGILRKPESKKVARAGGTITFADATRPPVLVWQDRQLLPTTVDENIQLVYKGKDQLVMRKLLEEFDLLDMENVSAWDLSGGQQLSLAMIRALLVEKAGAMVFDEPTAGVDIEKKYQVAHNIMRFRRGDGSGARTVIVITHDEELVAWLGPESPSVLSLEKPDGRGAVLSGERHSISDLYNRPWSEFTARFSGWRNVYKVSGDQENFISRSDSLHQCINTRDAVFTVLIPEDVILVRDAHTQHSFEAMKIGIEYDRRGKRYCRYRVEPPNAEVADFVVEAPDGQHLPMRGWINIHPADLVYLNSTAVVPQQSYSQLPAVYDAALAKLSTQTWEKGVLAEIEKDVKSAASVMPSTKRLFDVLDIGAGTGVGTRMLYERFRANVLAVDVSQAMLTAGISSGHVNPQRNICCSLRDLHAGIKDQFDYVVAGFDTMNYFTASDLQVLFRVVKQCLKPGGALIFDYSSAHLFEWVWNPRDNENAIGEEEFDIGNARDKKLRMRRQYHKDDRLLKTLVSYVERVNGEWRCQWTEEHYQYSVDIHKIALIAERSQLKVSMIRDIEKDHYDPLARTHVFRVCHA